MTVSNSGDGWNLVGWNSTFIQSSDKIIQGNEHERIQNVITVSDDGYLVSHGVKFQIDELSLGDGRSINLSHFSSGTRDEILQHVANYFYFSGVTLEGTAEVCGYEDHIDVTKMDRTEEHYAVTDQSNFAEQLRDAINPVQGSSSHEIELIGRIVDRALTQQPLITARRQRRASGPSGQRPVPPTSSSPASGPRFGDSRSDSAASSRPAAGPAAPRNSSSDPLGGGPRGASGARPAASPPPPREGPPLGRDDSGSNPGGPPVNPMDDRPGSSADRSPPTSPPPSPEAPAPFPAGGTEELSDGGSGPVDGLSDTDSGLAGGVGAPPAGSSGRSGLEVTLADTDPLSGDPAPSEPEPVFSRTTKKPRPLETPGAPPSEGGRRPAANEGLLSRAESAIRGWFKQPPASPGSVELGAIEGVLDQPAGPVPQIRVTRVQSEVERRDTEALREFFAVWANKIPETDVPPQEAILLIADKLNEANRLTEPNFTALIDDPDTTRHLFTLCTKLSLYLEEDAVTKQREVVRQQTVLFFDRFVKKLNSQKRITDLAEDQLIHEISIRLQPPQPAAPAVATIGLDITTDEIAATLALIQEDDRQGKAMANFNNHVARINGLEEHRRMDHLRDEEWAKNMFELVTRAVDLAETTPEMLSKENAEALSGAWTSLVILDTNQRAQDWNQTNRLSSRIEALAKRE